MRRLLILLAVCAPVACQQKTEAPAEAPATDAVIDQAAEAPSLAESLGAQPDDVKARYQYRNPKETLEFIGIEPGMAVVEGLPGKGWYSKVLLPYLGESGCLIGANYEMDMWPLFPFGTEEFVAEKSNWKATFTADAKEWRGDSGADVRAFVFGSMPDDYAGTADVVFFPRVLHNLANFQNAGEGEFLNRALADAYAVLKPGGTFGVVQHEARDDMPDEFANGTHGYLKKSFVIEQAEAAGFEFVAESDINQNDLDQPSADDIVWRLPPTLATSEEDEELRAKYVAIGESNRMTLKFRKPTQID